ncbi:MAG: transcription-repair coupling factor, partial [Lachnospira sp.]|nr:transcription-repair coupling factor [Lachnospira sp.]
MDTFYDPIRKLEGIKELNTVLDGKGGKLVSISGCIDTQKVHLASAIASDYNFLLIVSSDEVKARKIAEDAAFFNENVSYYPAKDAIFYNADISGKQIVGQRIEVINKIINEDKLTIVTTIDALSDTLIPIEKYIDSTLVFKTDDVLDLDKIKSKLVAIGYERMPMVEGRGQFSIRGGIIDIFPFTSETPVRIELWDDEIDSIRYFDVDSQRSIEKVKEIRVFPATEYIFTEEE